MLRHTKVDKMCKRTWMFEELVKWVFLQKRLIGRLGHISRN